MYMIRTATQNDLKAIVQVHRICFPKSFTTAMGNHLLTKYYQEFMAKNPDLFLVSESETDGTINGFCMGYYGENSGSTKQFMYDNRFRFMLRVLWLLLTCNRSAWKRALGVLRKKQNTVTVNDTFRPYSHKDSGELLSICVLPEQRGGGVASQLVDQYTQVLIAQGRHRCVLSTFMKKKASLYSKKLAIPVWFMPKFC